MKQFRNVVITLNNWSTYEYLSLTNMCPKYFSYIIIGKEVGDSGTPHLQCYAELTSRKTLQALKALVPRAHFEGRLGSQFDAINYCKKEGDFDELGSPRRQGNRTDLSTVRRIIDGGGTVRNIFTDKQVTLNESTIRFAEKYLSYRECTRVHKPIVCWFYGPSGSGKTRLAHSLLPHAYFKNTATGKWWDGYDGHEDVIIDDLRPEYIDFVELLGLLDRYEHRIQIKGGVRQFKATRIIITCPEEPRKMYGHLTESMQQLERRIDHCCEILPEDDQERLELEFGFFLSDPDDILKN